MNNPRSTVAVPWYPDPMSYRSIRAMAADKSSLPPRYMDWRNMAETNVRLLLGKGHDVQRVDIYPTALRDFCRESGHDTDSEGRQAYADQALGRPTPLGDVMAPVGGVSLARVRE